MAMKKTCKSGHMLYATYNEKIYECNGCKTKGVGLTHGCRACEFYLHPECMESTDTISSDICKGHLLKFCKQPPQPANKKSRKAKDFAPPVCRACGMGVLGFAYRCEKKGTYLHPRCALLKAEIPMPAPAAAVDHPAIKLILKKKSKYCEVCRSAKLKSAVDEKKPGWYYAYIDDGGREHAGYHVHCLMKLLSETSPDKMKEGGGRGRVRSHGSGSSGVSPENFTNGNPTLECLEIIKKPIRADIPSEYSKKKKPGGGGRSKFVLKICRSILAAVVSILVGDPTTLLANAMMEAVLQLVTTN